jgi:hypothetical protein
MLHHILHQEEKLIAVCQCSHAWNDPNFSQVFSVLRLLTFGNTSAW